MKSETPTSEGDETALFQVQAVEFALILSRMINTVKEDPAQLRLSIYEFARARLQIDTSWADETERERFSAALETAIQGVEQFSARRDDRDRLQPPTQPAQIALGGSPAEPTATSIVTIHQLNSASKSAVVKEVYSRPDAEAIARKAMAIAADICVNTNKEVVIESLESKS
jgi:hypothetical protein